MCLNDVIDARRACCDLIDLIANGLKFVLSPTEDEYEDEYEKIEINEQDNQQSKNSKIQELHREVYEDNMRSNRSAIKTNFVNKDMSMRSVVLFVSITTLTDL